jgi:hypothetical protein
MSLTVFLAMCVLGVDFLIYFFFKMVYGEKHRIRPRRLPPEYYKENAAASSLTGFPRQLRRKPHLPPHRRHLRPNQIPPLIPARDSPKDSADGLNVLE